MRPDYNIFYKKKYASTEKLSEKKWDLFISAFNDSERVSEVYKAVNSSVKHWLIMPDYAYIDSEMPKEYYYKCNQCSESEYVINYFEKHKDLLLKSNICIDITGFMRPHLIFMFRYFKEKNISKIDVLYSDPITYKNRGETKFTIDKVYDVRQVQGCEGSHVPNVENDLLIIGSGYDEKLIASVSETKAKAKKIQVFGFPSLQPDMYQENILRAYKAEDALGGDFLEKGRNYYAPANDPFVTAGVLSDIVYKENRRNPLTNIYLSPLATKAQVLGFVLYYIWECLNSPVSILFPFCQTYTRETSEGLSKIWLYSVELPK